MFSGTKLRNRASRALRMLWLTTRLFLNAHNVAITAFERPVLSLNRRIKIAFLDDLNFVFLKEWTDFTRLSKSEVDKSINV